jgi:phthiocerol/phenolphthiocerol synthesis type-I polyketide synthase E
LAAALATRGVAGRRLHTSHAFHSAMMEPVLDRFAAEVAKVDLSAPRLSYLSNVTGTWIKAEEATDPGYWARHLRQAVRFADGVAELVRAPGRVLLEVGPGSALTAMAKRQARVEVVASSRHPGEEADDGAVLLGAAGRLWTAGVDLDWRRLHEGERRRRIPLPTYPFERERYWVERVDRVDRVEAATEISGSATARPRLAADVADWFHVPAWLREDPPPQPADAAHTAGPWLVLADPGGLGERLAVRLRASGARVRVAPWRTSDLDALLSEAAPKRIVHLGSLDPATWRRRWADARARLMWWP